MLRKPSGSVVSYTGGMESDGDNDLLPSTTQMKPATKPHPADPKPTSEKTGGTSQSSSTVQKAFEATGFKSVNGEYQLQGRVGIALLAGVHKPDFKLLVYAAGNVVVTQAIVTATFQISVSGLYVSYYDAFNQSWSFLFESEGKVADFVQFITIAKFRTNNSANIEFTDRIVGAGDKLSIGDSVEIRYTGWVLQANGTLGTVFETKNSSTAKPLRFKLGKSKSIKAWDDGLIGMQRGTHRLLVVPSNKAYGKKGLSPKVPGGSNVVFDVEVLRVRVSSHETNSSVSLEGSASETSHSRSRGISNVTEDPPLPLLPDNEEDSEISTFKDRTFSISKKLEGKPTKQDLISRMAAMGQAMLPQSANAPATESDLDDSEVSLSETPNNSQNVPVIATTQNVVQPTPTFTQQNAAPVFQSYMPMSTMANSGYPINPYHMQATAQSGQQLMAYSSVRPLAPTQQVFSMDSPTTTTYQPTPQVVQPSPSSNSAEQIHTAMLVNETRQQNTEVRLSIAKLQDKMDTIIGKVDQQLHNDSGRIVSAKVTVPTMENTMLLQNLTRIIQENNHLKEEIFHKSEKIEKQNKKITELLSKNEACLGENNESIERSADSFKASASQSQAKVLELEEQKLKLMQDLSKRTSEVYDQQIALDGQKSKNLEQNRKLATNASKLESFEREVSDLQIANGDLRESLAEVKIRFKEEKDEFRNTEKKLQESEECLQELRQNVELKEKVLQQKTYRTEEERQKVIAEFQLFKTESEKEADELRKKLRQERASGYSDTSVIQNQIEKEVTERWKKRCDQLVKTEAERFERRLIEVEEDNNRLQGENEALHINLQTMKDQTREMKRTLQEEINQLSNSLENATDEARIAKRTSSTISNKEIEPSGEDLSEKVRAIMNSVYRSIRENIAASNQYEGFQIHEIVKAVIRDTTLSLTNDNTEDDEEEESDNETDESEVASNENDSDVDENDGDVDEDNEGDRLVNIIADDSINENLDSKLTFVTSNAESDVGDANIDKLNDSIKGEALFTSANSEASSGLSHAVTPPIPPGLSCVVHPVQPDISEHENAIVQDVLLDPSDNEPSAVSPKHEVIIEESSFENETNSANETVNMSTPNMPKTNSKPLFSDDED